MENELFASWTGKSNLEGKKPEEILPLAQNAFELMSVRDGEQVIQMEDHYYRMRYYSVETQERHSKKENTSSGLMLYLTDITDFELLRQKYSNDKLCLAYVRFDNYEEVMRGLSETNMANLNGEINELLTKWAASKQGFICRMNKESSLMGFSMSAVMDMMEDKFMILDKVREIRSGNKIPPTVSIGVACDGVTLEELIGNANKSLYLALGRGGDQAVVMKDKNTQFLAARAVLVQKARVYVRVLWHRRFMSRCCRLTVSLLWDMSMRIMMPSVLLLVWLSWACRWARKPILSAASITLIISVLPRCWIMRISFFQLTKLSI